MGCALTPLLKSSERLPGRLPCQKHFGGKKHRFSSIGGKKKNFNDICSAQKSHLKTRAPAPLGKTNTREMSGTAGALQQQWRVYREPRGARPRLIKARIALLNGQCVFLGMKGRFAAGGGKDPSASSA